MMLRVVVRVAAPFALLLWPVVLIGACDMGTSSTASATAVQGNDRRTPITVTTSPPGASVVVDGAVVGEAPVTVPLNPGPHRLRATMSGYYPGAELKIVVERGVPTTHTLSLVASH